MLVENQPPPGAGSFKFPKETIGDLDADTAARVMAASSDIAMVIDRDGIIRDIAVSARDLAGIGFDDIVARRWVDTVAGDSRRKVEEMLGEAAASRGARWREINQQSAQGAVPLRCIALGAGHDGRVIALGRDLRVAASLQQQVIQAQQEMERGYVRLRQAEARYRVLFQIASEAVLVVDLASKKIVEANPAAGRLLAVDYGTLAGRQVVRLFHEDTRDRLAALLSDATARGQTEPVPLRLADGRSGFSGVASLFRHDGASHVLLSLAKTAADVPVMADEAKVRLLRILNHIPDAFVVTDEALNILDANLAFLELTQLASADSAKGQSLGQFLGRPGADLRVLVGNLQEHGWVRNFGTVARTVFGDVEDVELSAVSVPEGLEAAYGFVFRPSRRALQVPAMPVRGLPRTAEQLTQLVGRVSLREIVAETTDVIEQMCIEAALSLTGNNRANAAEVLGLSRQSLYSKLKRHGVASSDPEQDSDA